MVIENNEDEPETLVSPSKKFGGETSAGCAISTMVAVKRSPTVSKSLLLRVIGRSDGKLSRLLSSHLSER